MRAGVAVEGFSVGHLTGDRAEPQPIRRFFDGPFTAPTPTSPAASPIGLLKDVPLLRTVLRDADPPIPAIRDWSYRASEPLDESRWFSHWVKWTSDDQVLLAQCLRAEVDEQIRALIKRWTWIWPDVAAMQLPVKAPSFIARLEAAHADGPAYRRTREAHRAAWIDTALHVGLFEHYRSTTPWPDPEATSCRTCGRRFAPETLSHWMRRYGTARYCAACCCRARNGRGHATREETIAAIRAVVAHLSVIPPQAFAISADIAALAEERRDLAMAVLICLPRPEIAAEALGISSQRGKWLGVLLAAGVVDTAWRPARGTLCIAKDGHACRSLGERTIDDYLGAQGIAHEPEPPWPRHPRLNPNGRLRADWRLADGTYVEYAGMLEDDAYAAKIATKVRLAQEMNLPLLVITRADLLNLSALIG